MSYQISTILRKSLKSSATLWLLLCLALGMIRDTSADETVDYQARLLEDIFHNSRIDPKKRPVKAHKDVIAVQAYLIILHIYRLDEVTGTLTVNGWAEFHWDDPQLLWDPTNYDGIVYTEIPDVDVWKPDMTILNPVDASAVFEYGKVRLVVSSTGHVDWVPPFRSRTSCSINHRYFPYDEHVCNIQMGSWIYDTSRLSLNIPYEKHPEQEGIIKKFSIENPSWEITDTNIHMLNVTMDCCPNIVFPHIEYTLRIRRKSPLYKFLFVMPSVMSMLLTLATFWLPANAGEKLTLGGISTILQMALLFALSTTIPPGGTHIPHIVLFIGNSLVMTCFSLIVSVLVIRLSRSHTYTPLPSLVKNFLSGPVGQILCLGSNAGAQAETNILAESEKELESPEENQNGGAQSSSEKTSCFGDWILLAAAIDHMCFIIYCVVFAIIIVSSFSM